MAPFASTRVLHPRFEAHHRATAEGAMTAECVILRPSSAGTYNSTVGRSEYPSPSQIYPAAGNVGVCRVQRTRTAAAPAEVGERAVTIREYIVSVPADSDPVQVNDIVEITACAGDEVLIGQSLVVRDAGRGSVTWLRDLSCEMYPATSR